MSLIRVLLVEDSPTYAQLVRSMLSVAKGADFTVQHVDSLADSIEQLEREEFDAVLLDLMLPDSGGLDTLDRLSTVAGGTPIVVLTSIDDEESSLRALHQGAADYLIKSEVSANWLSRALIYAIERRRVEAAARATGGERQKEASSILVVEQVGDQDGHFVARFTERRLVNVVALERVKLRLFRLVKEDRVRQLSLDFSQVEYVANAAISVLLLVNKHAAAHACTLVLEHVSPSVLEHLATRRFDRVFNIR
jgi:DNA-binding response OmpR family regulator